MKQSSASDSQLSSTKALLVETAERAAQYLEGIAHRRVAPLPADVARLEALAGPLPEWPSDPAEVLALLDDIGSPATMASAGGRYFGFVIGGSLPAALAANWLAGAWDQNAAMQVMSPVAAKLEEIVLEWMVDLLGLPPDPGRDLSPAQPWPTLAPWLPRGPHCCSVPDGMSRRTDYLARPQSRWWWATKFTSLC